MIWAFLACGETCWPGLPAPILSPAPGAEGVPLDVRPAFSMDAAPSLVDVRLVDAAGDEVPATWWSKGFYNGRTFQAIPDEPLALDAGYALVGVDADGEPAVLTSFTTGDRAWVSPTVGAMEGRRSRSGERACDLDIVGDVAWVEARGYLFAPDAVTVCLPADVILVRPDGASFAVRIPAP